MNLNRKFFSCTAAVFAGVLFVIPANTADTDFSVLESLDRGMWQFRAVGGAPSSIATNQICLKDPAQLTQIQHGSISCSHFVVRSNQNSVTVSYSCRGQGQGLTMIRKESNRLIQIQSQGIKNNAPFSFAVEGRYAGKC